MRHFLPVSTFVILSGTAFLTGLVGCESSRTNSQFGPIAQVPANHNQSESNQSDSSAGTDGPTIIALPAAGASFVQAFDAARKVLVAHNFELDRVDALNGVITTAPKTSAGLASPWDLDQTSFKQEIDDFVNYQERRVRIEFERSAQDANSSWVGNVTVNMYRHQTPGSRVSSKSATLWTATRDPVKDQQGLGLYYKVATKRDIKLERRLAEEIDEALTAAMMDEKKTAAK